MKLRAKLLIAFCIISLLVAVPALVNLEIIRHIKKMIATEMQIGELASNLRLEESIGYSCIAGDEETSESEFKRFEAKYGKDQEELERLANASLLAKERESLKSIAERHMAFGEFLRGLQAARRENIGRANRIQALAEEIRLKRQIIRDKYFADPALAGQFSSEISYEFEGNLMNDSIRYVFRSLESGEKEFFWLYRDREHELKHQKSVERFLAIVRASPLSEELKQIFLNVVTEYSSLFAELKSLLDYEDLELLIHRKTIITADIREERELLDENYFSLPEHQSAMRTPIHFEYKGEQFFEDAQFVMKTMEYHEYEYIWQAQRDLFKNFLETDMGKFEALIGKNQRMSADIKKEFLEFLEAYRAQIGELTRINEKIAKKEAEKQRETALAAARLAELANAMLQGGGGGDAEGLDFLLAAGKSQRERLLTNSKLLSQAAGAGAFALAVLFGILISGSIARPIVRLGQAADKIGQGQLGERAEVTAQDEIGDLARSFNRMAEELSRTMISKEHMDKIVESMNDGLVVTALSGEIVKSNSRAAELLGFAREELIGKRIGDLAFGELGDPAGPDAGGHREAELRQKDGSLLPVGISGAVMTGAGGEATGYVWTFRDMSEMKGLIDRLEKSENRLRALSQKSISMQEEERERVSRELHDALGQRLSALSVEAHWLKKQAAPNPQSIGALADMLDETSRELVRIYRGMRPLMLAKLGLTAALGALVQEFRETGAFELECELLQFGRDELPGETALHIYRFVQEALTNAARHAQAEHCAVSLCEREGFLLAVVSDDGMGMGEADRQKGGVGLAGMEERALICGGRLEIRSEKGKGSTLTFRAPLEKCGGVEKT